MVDGYDVTLADKIDRQLDKYTYKQASYALLICLDRLVNRATREANNTQVAQFILDNLVDEEIKLRLKINDCNS